VLVAAGRGERLGEDRPKAFARLGGLPLLAEPLRRLDESEWIDGVVVVAPPGWEEACILLAEQLGATKVSACIAGGETRSASVRIGLAEVPDDAAVVLVHDAARPLVPPEIVPTLLEALGEGFEGAVPGLPVADTVKRVREGVVVGTPARDELVAVQTPQAFVASVLRSAAAGEGSDCASLVEAAGGRVKVVPGDERLLKVTTPGDLKRVEAWLPPTGSRFAAVAAIRIGMGYDAHALTEGVPLVLGGVELDHPRGLAGHSDGDVIAHALIDAVLGAAGLGDIGSLFPSGEERFRGVSSLVLLEEAYAQVKDAGWRLVNADCVLVGEEPRIAPHREEMRRRLTEILGEGEVNVRATTTDHLGFPGRGEGLAAHAVALLEAR
jgi:2-C-methyl-D-erythritol 4-phosphate cytidylyltransferase/2-C-methyl-D-erythritol 2,4-cyclodiphosphate synthase